MKWIKEFLYGMRTEIMSTSKFNWMSEEDVASRNEKVRQITEVIAMIEKSEEPSKEYKEYVAARFGQSPIWVFVDDFLTKDKERVNEQEKKCIPTLSVTEFIPIGTVFIEENSKEELIVVMKGDCNGCFFKNSGTCVDRLCTSKRKDRVSIQFRLNK